MTQRFRNIASWSTAKAIDSCPNFNLLMRIGPFNKKLKENFLYKEIVLGIMKKFRSKTLKQRIIWQAPIFMEGVSIFKVNVSVFENPRVFQGISNH